MQKFKYFIFLHLFILFLFSFNDNENIKGKKGDFSYRKCFSCKILDE
tara:strand:+ start:625 stop:765 length:141 start_codon:yes stop_codon:yes gene_type:complete